MKNPLRPINSLLACSTLLVAAGLAFAQHTPVPRGAADAVTSTQPVAPLPAMPPNHPRIGGPVASMPASTLPDDANPMHPAGMFRTPKSGALRVLLTQGTKDGTPIVNDPVTVDLYAKGKILKSYSTKISDKGVVELTDLPLDPPYQPVVNVTHSGVVQQMIGEAIHKMQPAIEFEMKVYEATDTPPAWTIGMRHVVTEPVGDTSVTGIKVIEMIGGYNPTDRAWTGNLLPNKERETLSVQLPPNATDVLFGPGMLEANAKVVDGRVTRPGVMLPGSTSYVLAYTLPVKDGKATLTFTAPADITLFAVYAPTGAKVVSSTGIEVGKAQGTHGDKGMQLLKAKSVKTGAVATIELSNIVLPPKAATQPKNSLKPEGHP